jgi:hypothetical protein
MDRFANRYAQWPILRTGWRCLLLCVYPELTHFLTVVLCLSDLLLAVADRLRAEGHDPAQYLCDLLELKKGARVKVCLSEDTAACGIVELFCALHDHELNVEDTQLDPLEPLLQIQWLYSFDDAKKWSTPISFKYADMHSDELARVYKGVDRQIVGVRTVTPLGDDIDDLINLELTHSKPKPKESRAKISRTRPPPKQPVPST